MRLLPALLLLSCATWPRGFLFQDTTFPVVCRTACNVDLLGPNPGGLPLPASWTCESVQEVEDRVIKMLRTPAMLERDPRFLHACPALENWQIWVEATKNIQLATLEGGDADCGMARIFIGNSAPADGALAHELIHAVQGCQPIGDGEKYQDPHYNWAPIYSALADAGFDP